MFLAPYQLWEKRKEIIVIIIWKPSGWVLCTHSKLFAKAILLNFHSYVHSRSCSIRVCNFSDDKVYIIIHPWNYIKLFQYPPAASSSTFLLTPHILRPPSFKNIDQTIRTRNGQSFSSQHTDTRVRCVPGPLCQRVISYHALLHCADSHRSALLWKLRV